MIGCLVLGSILAIGPGADAEQAPLRKEEQIISADPGPLREDALVVKVRPLSWEGKAVVHAGGREIHIRVRTRISRTGSVISESWPVEEGEQTLRRMIIDDTGGWMERGGKREPMPDEMLKHERQQFEFYAQLQPAIAFARMVGSGQTTISGNISTSFRFDAGRPVEARNQVISPEPGGKSIEQTFLLSEYKAEHGFAWPRRIEILHDGKPYFTLEIEKFEAGAVP